jgi:hypothetical protein
MPIARLAVGTAVVAGTAGAVSHHQQQKYANQASQQQAAATSQQVAMDQQQMAAQMDAMAQQQAQLAQQQAALAQQQAQAQQAPAQVAAPAADDTIAQLQKLAELQKAGILTEEEFAAKKKQLLGI